MITHSSLDFRNVIDRLVIWCKHRRASREVEGLSEADFSVIARDLNLSPGDLEAAARKSGDRAVNLSRLFGVLGIDGAEILRTEPSVMRDMERVCALCPATARCDRDLRKGAFRRTYREYCANSATIDALPAADDHGSCGRHVRGTESPEFSG